MPKLQPRRSSISRRNSVESVTSSICTSSSNHTSSSDSEKPKPVKRKRDVSIDGKIIYCKEYVVEKIFAHDYKYGQHIFLVKWKGWSDENNTWEPVQNLENCPYLLQEFFEKNLEDAVLNELCDWLKIERHPKQNVLEQHIPEGGFDALPNKLLLQKEFLRIWKTSRSKRSQRMHERSTKNVYLYLIIKEREQQLIKLKQWQDEMNRVAIEDAAIVVENNVDLEGPPQGFTYTNDYIPGEGITIPNEPIAGCDCKEGCNGRARNCCYFSNLFPYARKGRVNIIQGIPIYECNKLCTCDASCRNRVVQHGRKVPLCIFRTSTGCGWGVKTLRAVSAGEFICEYVGEVISFDEAERRGKGYDAEGRTYLFDLDFERNDFPYTVDAATYGNVAHFINHSCQPNLGVWAVWINCIDPNLPKLALFATRSIEKGKEITFDYMCNVSEEKPKNTNIDSPSRKRLTNRGKTNSTQYCKCGAKKCRRYLF